MLLALGIGSLLIAGGLWTQLDLDADGLRSHEELDHGTDPFRADTDGDRLADGWELARSLDPRSTDTDMDTLTDLAELLDGTDPRSQDTDEDGITDPAEPGHRTHPRVADTDGDGLLDGRELAVGTPPTDGDADADSVGDGRELVAGSDPHAADTDLDAIPDPQELADPRDCDGDGFAAVADDDDDADDRTDGQEPTEHRCQPDVDGDGLLDGHEANEACIERPDCDADALGDGTELGTEFDRLDPDTFDVGLPDGVSWTFQQHGQPPSRDDDADGIPDRWERTAGLIRWGPFDPEPGARDLLIEFVRVEGPDSGPLGPGPLTPAYEDVERFLETEGGLSVDWVQTGVRLDQERRPPLIPSSASAYYREILAGSDHAANPYVTTVVMNPQHDMTEIAHLGVAPIRGMLAAVDYGAHANVHFRVGDQRFRVSPMLESLVVGDRQDLLRNRGFTESGRTAEGELFVRTPDWTMTWRPFWFATPPTFRFDDGSTVQATRTGVIVEEAELADTIAHELGHTLGLCHTNLPTCQRNLSTEDQGKVGVSTMDERRGGPTLAFLPSEWETVRGYLSCPPVRPITLIAQGANRSAVLDAKYRVTLENVLKVNVRECEDREPIPAVFDPASSSFRYESPVQLAEDELVANATVYRAPEADTLYTTASRETRSSLAYAVGSALVTAAALAGAAVWLRRRAD